MMAEQPGWGGSFPDPLFEMPGNLSRHSEAEADRITQK
jgi:hypothetical protein